MPEQNPMVTVGDTYTVRVPRDYSQCAMFSAPANAAATFTLVPEVSFDEGISYATQTLTKADLTVATTSITAVGSANAGWARIPGATHVRLRLTVITTPATGVTGRIAVTKGV